MVLCAFAEVDRTCNATMFTGKSIGGTAYRQLKGSTVATACCAACVADPKCAAFVTADDGARAAAGRGECLLKADLQNLHAKATNDCGIVRGTLAHPGRRGPRWEQR